MNLGDQELTPLTQKNSQYQPTHQQLIDYALYIGFILPQDEHLLYIAHEGLKADLPPNWQAYGNKKGDLFYKDLISETIQEEHPADQMVKEKYLRQKKRLQLLAAQKQVIVEQNQSDLASSEVYKMMKTSNSQKEQGKSYLKTQERRIEQNVYSQRSMQSVQSMNQEGEEIPVSTNFYGSQSRTLQPEIIDFNQLTVKLNQKYSNKLQQQISSITLNPIKQKQIVYQNHKTQKFTQEIEQLGNVIKEKQEMLSRLTQERMRKQKQIIKIQEQFQLQKQQILESYRKKLRAKLEAQKMKKEKEFENGYNSTLKRQYKNKQLQMIHDGFRKK